MFANNDIQGSFFQRLNIIVNSDICKEQLHEVSREPTTGTENISISGLCSWPFPGIELRTRSV
jgi:hypothetical protein